MPLNLTRSILAILLPGGVAVLPWVVLVVIKWETLGKWYLDFALLANGVLFGLAVIVGKVFETMGSRIEVKWDNERDRKYAVYENWFAYLARSIDPEPVGNRYISRLVTSMYFALTMTFSTVVFFCGFATLFFVSGFSLKPLYVVISIILAVAGPIFFFRDAKESHKDLCIVRLKINARHEADP